MEAGTPGPEVMDYIGGGGEAGNDGPMAAEWTKKRRPRRRVWFTVRRPVQRYNDPMHARRRMAPTAPNACAAPGRSRRAPAGPILRCEL